MNLRLIPFPSSAMQALQAELHTQAEQQAATVMEQEGCRRQLGQQRQRNDSAAAVERKLGGQAERLAAQVARVQQRRAELQVRPYSGH